MLMHGMLLYVHFLRKTHRDNVKVAAGGGGGGWVVRIGRGGG